MNGLRDLPGSCSGSVATLTALMMTVMVGAGGLAVDVGLAFMQEERLQAATDAAALAAAADPSRGEATARSLLDRYGFEDADLVVSRGSYRSGMDRDKRLDLSIPGSAVRVEAGSRSPSFLSAVLGFEGFGIAASSDAEIHQVVAISGGSRLASFDPRDLEKAFAPLLDVDLRLDVMDYRNLLAERVAIRDLAGAFGVDLSMPVEQALRTPRRLQEVLGDLAGTLGGRRSPAASVLDRLAISMRGRDASPMLSDLLDAGVPGAEGSIASLSEIADLKVDLVDLVSLGIEPAKGSDRVRAGISLPGIASVEVEASVGEGFQRGPAYAVGASPVLHAAQTTVRARIRTSGIVKALGVGIDLPLEVVVAGGRAEVSSVRCSGSSRIVLVDVDAGVFRSSVGSWKDGSIPRIGDVLPPATVVSVPLVRVEASGNVAATRTRSARLEFSASSIGNGTTKSVSTTTIAETLLTSTLQRTGFVARILGIGLSASGVQKAVSDALVPVGRPVDALLSTVLSALGVKVGEMDVRVDHLDCGRPRIVG